MSQVTTQPGETAAERHSRKLRQTVLQLFSWLRTPFRCRKTHPHRPDDQSKPPNRLAQSAQGRQRLNAPHSLPALKNRPLSKRSRSTATNDDQGRPGRQPAEVAAAACDEGRITGPWRGVPAQAMDSRSRCPPSGESAGAPVDVDSGTNKSQRCRPLPPAARLASRSARCRPGPSSACGQPVVEQTR